jgi:hypothetical protein
MMIHRLDEMHAVWIMRPRIRAGRNETTIIYGRIRW